MVHRLIDSFRKKERKNEITVLTAAISKSLLVSLLSQLQAEMYFSVTCGCVGMRPHGSPSHFLSLSLSLSL